MFHFAFGRQARGHHRREGERHESRKQHRGRERQAELAEESAGITGQERDRYEDCHERQRRGDDREADFLAAAHRSHQWRLVEFCAAVDVLEHDDRIVDHESDRQHDAE